MGSDKEAGMAKRLRDHFVPRVLIRQFCNSKGRIFCFDKEKGRIPDREVGNTPREILHKKAFYADPLGNLDEELYKPIENEFGPHLLRLVRDPHAAVKVSGFTKALIDWIAAQTSRTELIAALTEEILRKDGPEQLLEDPDQLAITTNLARRDNFERTVELMQLPKWKWKMYKLTDSRRFVLGDHPVCNTTTSMEMGFMLFVPLSPVLILVGGSVEGQMLVKDGNLLRGINAYIYSYSRRFTYSACLEELDSIQAMYDAKGDTGRDAFMKLAREPHHGLSRRVQESDPPPDHDPDSLRKRFL